MQESVKDWRQRWVSAGVPTIPLLEGHKNPPLCKDWPFRSTEEQWHTVGADFKGNIAARMGNGVAVADADSPQAVENLEDWLTGLGIKLENVPTVRTASGAGRHFYLHTGKIPESAGHAYGILTPDIGAGELRYGPSAYVVAPCSRVGNASYRFIRSYPEAVRKNKQITWRDLRKIVRVTQYLELEHPPVRLVWRPMSLRVKNLLRKLSQTKGPTKPFVGYNRYPNVRYKYYSRSEAEASVIASLILAGWNLSEIDVAFRDYQPGHYREHARPDWYLSLTYHRILGMLAIRPKRQQLALIYRQSAAMPWPGKGGALAFAVYRALIASCWQFDCRVVTASVRYLAEHAAASIGGVHNALEYLLRHGWIFRAKPWQPEPLQGGTWVLPYDTPTDTQVFEGTGGSGSVVNGDGVADIWAQEHLGHSAHLVYSALDVAGEASVSDLCDITGKNRNTVSRALSTLESWDLVGKVGRKWSRGAGKLVRVAIGLNTLQTARHRRLEHELHRDDWQERREELARKDSGGESPDD
jgi:DNA-binding transcriptional ArsR family regulator